MESIFASDSVKNCPAHKGGFFDWLELDGNTIEKFISLAEVDLANKKPPEQAYLEKFNSKTASALLDMHLELLRFLYDGLIPAVGLTLLAALPKVGKSWFVLNLAKHIDAEGIPLHYLAAEDNEGPERSCSSRIQRLRSAPHLPCRNVDRRKATTRCSGSFPH